MLFLHAIISKMGQMTELVKIRRFESEARHCVRIGSLHGEILEQSFIAYFCMQKLDESCFLNNTMTFPA